MDVSFDQVDVIIINQPVQNIDQVSPPNETLVKLQFPIATQMVDILYLDDQITDMSKTVSLKRIKERTIEIESILPFDIDDFRASGNEQRENVYT